MRWQVKCVIDNCKGLLPFQNQLRKAKRHLFSYQPCLPRGRYAVEQGLVQIHWIREALGTLRGKSILEIGSGWEPLIPLLFFLCGAEHVYLTDSTHLLDVASLRATLMSLRANRDLIIDSLGLAPKTFDDKLAHDPISTADFLSRFRFTYFAPCDCGHLPLPDSSLDSVTSRAVFEHIPADIIREILGESQRVLKPGAVMCHLVDNSDHWEHGDKRISRVNFLRFEEREFRLTYLNKLNYQNRLRHRDYVEMLLENRFQIIRDEREIDQRSLEELRTLPLAIRFRSYSPEDLATTDSYLLARK